MTGQHKRIYVIIQISLQLSREVHGVPGVIYKEYNMSQLSFLIHIAYYVQIMNFLILSLQAVSLHSNTYTVTHCIWKYYSVTLHYNAN